jgi:hypothetical protein
LSQVLLAIGLTVLALLTLSGVSTLEYWLSQRDKDREREST